MEKEDHMPSDINPLQAEYLGRCIDRLRKGMLIADGDQTNVANALANLVSENERLRAALAAARQRLMNTGIHRAGEARNKEDGLKEIDAALGELTERKVTP